LNQGRFRPKKRFGQNFLHDRGTAVKIVNAAHVTTNELVVELGPGHGVLTKLLGTGGAHLVALELDRNLVAELEAEFDLKLGAGSEERRRVEVISADFTTVKLAELVQQRGRDRCVLIGNIPYHITRHVLFDFLVEEHQHVSRAVIMMQREVGDRIASGPGSRVYGIPSVVLQSLYEIKVVTKVAAGSFFPRPKVASIVLSFTPLARPLVSDEDRRDFVLLVKNLFQQRRKTIHNALRSFYELGDDALIRIGETTGIDLKLRPEMLSKEQFVLLAGAVRTEQG
jgi:16S rRNA (adenine1518-N6/adenine1519-N6)-dimethyltransferase